MKNPIAVLAFFPLLLGITAFKRSILHSFPFLYDVSEQGSACMVKTRASNDGYQLVWSDEFNHDGPVNDNDWSYETGFLRNHELQWYSGHNVRCEKGNLVIEATKTHEPNPNYLPDSRSWETSRPYIDYVSGSIKTENKRSWKYGRFVMRARINTSMGLWPAFWTLGLKGQWPSNGEIDIMESYRKKLLANIAIGTSQPYHAQWFSRTRAIDSLKDRDWSSKFHIWRMDWDQKGISLFVDDSLMNHMDMKSLYNMDNSGINPFQQPHYMILNLAIGGDNGGDPSNTVFPNRYEIDYVRVYQKAGEK
jgi:beta-glucanase (GH16 family)